MFEKMAKFSESIKGDFNALADVLSDKLVDVLNKLHTAIGDLSKTDAATPAVAQQAKQQAVETKETKQKIDTKALQNIGSAIDEVISISLSIFNFRFSSFHMSRTDFNSIACCLI